MSEIYGNNADNDFSPLSEMLNRFAEKTGYCVEISSDVRAADNGDPKLQSVFKVTCPKNGHCYKSVFSTSANQQTMTSPGQEDDEGVAGNTNGELIFKDGTIVSTMHTHGNSTTYRWLTFTENGDGIFAQVSPGPKISLSYTSLEQNRDVTMEWPPRSAASWDQADDSYTII